MAHTWRRRDELTKKDKDQFKKWRRDRKFKKGAKYVQSDRTRSDQSH